MNSDDEKTLVCGDPMMMTSPRGEKEDSSTILPLELRGRFNIRRVLGKGAFGIVYLAEDLEIGRLVAIKQLFKFRAGEKDIYKHFIQEAKIAGQLEHPNIVIVYDIEGAGESACIIMEYLGGGSLADLLKKDSYFSFHLASKIMLGILTGLDAAHSMMVVHRDIKPQNILFGIGNTPKITDFGIARLPASAGGFIELESKDCLGSVVGTPLYMSPEQVNGENLDQRTDIYSAGVIFYEMLTGEKLFYPEPEPSIEILREQILNSEPGKISKKRDDIPAEIDELIFKMLEKNPENRYPDAITVMRDLIKILAKTPAPIYETADDLLLLPTCQIRNSPAAILEDIIYLLLVDGIITPAERTELEKRTERLGLSSMQSINIEEKLRREMNLPSLEAIYKLTEKITSLKKQGSPLSEKQINEFELYRQELGISSEEMNILLNDGPVKNR
jgi:serine/threonine protein kinase